MQKGIIAFFFSLLISTAAQSQFYFGAGWNASMATSGMGNAYYYAYQFNHESNYTMVKEMHFNNFFNGPKLEIGLTMPGVPITMFLGWYNKHTYMSGSRIDIPSKIQEERDVKITYNAIQMGFKMKAYKGLMLGISYDFGNLKVLSKSNIGYEPNSYKDPYGTSFLFGPMASGCTLGANYVFDKRISIGLDYHFSVTDIEYGGIMRYRYTTSNIGINVILYLYQTRKKGLYDY